MNPIEEKKSVSIGRKEILENIGGLAIIAGIIVAGFVLLDMDAIKETIVGAGVWAPLLLIAAKASTMIFAPVSGSPLYPLAGALFGFGPAFLYLALGDALGGAISFGISRRFGRDAVARFIRKDMDVVLKAIETVGTPKGFLIARICLAALPEAASYAAGLTKLRFLPFFIIQNAVGIVPIAFLAFGGHKLIALSSPWAIGALLAAGFALAAAGLGAFLWWSKRGGEKKQTLA